MTTRAESSCQVRRACLGAPDRPRRSSQDHAHRRPARPAAHPRMPDPVFHVERPEQTSTGPVATLRARGPATTFHVEQPSHRSRSVQRRPRAQAAIAASRGAAHERSSGSGPAPSAPGPLRAPEIVTWSPACLPPAALAAAHAPVRAHDRLTLCDVSTEVRSIAPGGHWCGGVPGDHGCRTRSRGSIPWTRGQVRGSWRVSATSTTATTPTDLHGRGSSSRRARQPSHAGRSLFHVEPARKRATRMREVLAPLHRWRGPMWGDAVRPVPARLHPRRTSQRGTHAQAVRRRADRVQDDGHRRPTRERAVVSGGCVPPPFRRGRLDDLVEFRKPAAR